MGLKEDLEAERAAMASSSHAPTSVGSMLPGSPAMSTAISLAKMSVPEVQAWLAVNGLEDLMGPFKDNDIDGGALLELTEDDLKDETKLCYVKSYGQRKKLIRLIQENGSAVPQSVSVPPPAADPMKVPASAAMALDDPFLNASKPAMEHERRPSRYSQAMEFDVPEGNWSHNTLWCCSDVIMKGQKRGDEYSLVTAAVCCPCFIEGKIAAVVNSNFEAPIADPFPLTQGVMYENCCIHGCFCPFYMSSLSGVGMLFTLFAFPAAILASFMRLRIREKYNITGAQWQDAVVHFFLYPCALTQEYEDLRLRIDRPDGYVWKTKSILEE